MPLTATIQQKISTSFSEDASVADLKDVVNRTYTKSLVDGQGNEQSEEIYRERIAVASSSTVTRDLQSVTNPKGTALNFARVKFLAIINHGTADSDAQVKEAGEDLDLGATTFPGIGGIIEPGDWESKLSSFAGVTIGAGNKDLSIENTGTKTIYADVFAIGYE